MSKMSSSFRVINAFVILTVSVISIVSGENTECDMILENDENNYLAQSKLGNVFAGFNQVFDTVHRSDTLKKNLDTNTLNFFELLFAAKKIELEMKALDESRFNETIEDLCRDNSSDSVWLQCTNVIIRTAIGLKTLLAPVMAHDSEMNLRPRLG